MIYILGGLGATTPIFPHVGKSPHFQIPCRSI